MVGHVVLEMRHQAFLHRIARTDMASPEGRNLAAGLLALRQLDIWLDNPGLISEGQLAATIGQIREAGKPVSRLLTAAVRNLRYNDQANRVIGPFVAHGLTLIEEHEFALGVDVLETVLHVIEGPRLDAKDLWLTASCYIHLASAYVRMADWAAAERSIGHARRCIRSFPISDKQRYRILISYWGAVMASHRGNLGDAFAQLTRILTKTKGRSHPSVKTLTLFERARVLTVMGEPGRALVDLFRALRLAEGPRHLHHALADISATLINLGQAYATAFRIQSYLAAHGATAYLRSYNMVNVIESYDLHSDRIGVTNPLPHIQRWWDRFRKASHPLPEVELEGVMVYARAVERRISSDEALRMYADVARRATRQGFHRVAARADAEAGRVVSGIPYVLPPVKNSEPASADWPRAMQNPVAPERIAAIATVVNDLFVKRYGDIDPRLVPSY